MKGQGHFKERKGARLEAQENFYNLKTKTKTEQKNKTKEKIISVNKERDI